MMIKLIHGFLTKIDHWHSLSNKDATFYDDDSSNIPTMVSLVSKVVLENGTILDLKQIITYE